MFTMLFFSLALAAPESRVEFEFVGQPECVELEYDNGRTQLRNHCPDPILVDRSVQLPVEGQQGGLVPAETTTEIRDLSAFTMGMNGQLFRVIAVIAESEQPSDATH